jgi:Ser/Thr protein kinase RdoA (MazF antagonist)
VARQVLTHQVSIDGARGVVTKRFIQRGRNEPEREWRALKLLARHAPGLAPKPLRADLATSPAVVEMSLLPGEPLGGRSLSAAQLAAIAGAVSRLWRSVPISRVDPFPGEQRNNAQLVAVVSALLTADHDLGPEPVVATAFAEGRKWLAAARDRTLSPGPPPVFGQGDSNLANFLWDGERVRVVDFEDSGHSDRALEVAALVEHLSVWHEAGVDAERLIGAFDLSAAETARLADCRRLAALYWLLALRSGGAASGRNPPGMLRRQAERLLGLL